MLLTLPVATAAETPTPPPLPDPELPAPNRTVPEQAYPCNPGGYEPSTGKGEPELPYAYDCEGVIEPPASGDSEIYAPPPDPDAGTLPVIPPSTIDPSD